MKKFEILDGVAAPIDVPADTDQILPARFLRRPRNSGYGEFLFRDVRFRGDGSEIETFVLNQTPYRNAAILVGGRNFGSGSSREQAPWGLADYGIRCVIAADFGEIFYQNAIKAGILPIQLAETVCDALRKQLYATPGVTIHVNLPEQIVRGPDGAIHSFDIDDFRKHCLLNGLDDIGVTLQYSAEISAFEDAYRRRFDWLFHSNDDAR